MGPKRVFELYRWRKSPLFYVRFLVNLPCDSNPPCEARCGIAHLCPVAAHRLGDLWNIWCLGFSGLQWWSRPNFDEPSPFFPLVSASRVSGGGSPAHSHWECQDRVCRNIVITYSSPLKCVFLRPCVSNSRSTFHSKQPVAIYRP